MMSSRKSENDLAALETALLNAHAANDHDELVVLYRRAGEVKESAGDIDAACFFFTHAYVYALETGNPAAENLREKLASHGREGNDPLQRSQILINP